MFVKRDLTKEVLRKRDEKEKMLQEFVCLKIMMQRRRNVNIKFNESNFCS